MPNRKGFSKNNKNFNRENFFDVLYKPEGRPRPRETKSQKAQLESEHQHGTRKDRKLKISKKMH